jgi:hypothetical protein
MIKYQLFLKNFFGLQLIFLTVLSSEVNIDYPLFLLESFSIQIYHKLNLIKFYLIQKKGLNFNLS